MHHEWPSERRSDPACACGRLKTHHLGLAKAAAKTRHCIAQTLTSFQRRNCRKQRAGPCQVTFDSYSEASALTAATAKQLGCSCPPLYYSTSCQDLTGFHFQPGMSTGGLSFRPPCAANAAGIINPLRPDRLLGNQHAARPHTGSTTQRSDPHRNEDQPGLGAETPEHGFACYCLIFPGRPTI